MEYFPGVLSSAESDRLAARIRAHLARVGYGLWAVELVNRGGFIGFVGLSTPDFRAHFMPCTEIGWRIRFDQQGCGYATEAARAALRFGFERVGLDEIVSFTTRANTPSRHVMEKLGMERDPADDFEHPSLPAGHRLRPHVLYRLARERWEAPPLP